MALVFVQAGQNGTTTAGTTSTVTMTTAAGNLLVAFSREGGASNTATASMSDSSGTNTWTQTASAYVNPSSTSRCAMFYSPTTAGATSITVTWSASANRIDLVIFEISGAAASNVEDASVNSTDGGTAGQTSTSGTLTTSNANDILIMGTGVEGTFSAPTAGSNYTVPTNGSSNRAILEYRIVSSTQSATTTASWTTLENWSTIYAGFKASGSTNPAFEDDSFNAALNSVLVVQSESVISVF